MSISQIVSRWAGQPLSLGRKCALYLAVVASVSCGGQKRSMNVGFAVIPDRPIVITADAKDHYGGNVAAPWFSFRPILSNGSDMTVTVVALKISINGIDSSGNFTTTTKTYTPTDFPWAATVTRNGVTQTYSCTFTNFGEFASATADQKFTLQGDLGCPSCLQDGSAPPGLSSCIPHPVFFFGGGPGGPNNSFTTWSVQAQPLGWFGGYDDPKDRFQRSASFRTQ